MPATHYLLRTERLELHAADPVRAVSFLQAARDSVPELIPWMDWATDLPDEDGIIELMRSWRAAYDRDEDRHLHVIERATGRLVGVVGSHPRVPGQARELGYWMRSDTHGNGFATEAVRAVVRAELELRDRARIDIHVEPENYASKRIPEKLGFELQGLLRGHIPWAHGPDHDALVYKLFRQDLGPEHPIMAGAFEAFDAAGRRIATNPHAQSSS